MTPFSKSTVAVHFPETDAALLYCFPPRGTNISLAGVSLSVKIKLMALTGIVPNTFEHAALPSYSGSGTHCTSAWYVITLTASPAFLPEKQDRMMCQSRLRFQSLQRGENDSLTHAAGQTTDRNRTSLLNLPQDACVQDSFGSNKNIKIGCRIVKNSMHRNDIDSTETVAWARKVSNEIVTPRR